MRSKPHSILRPAVLTILVLCALPSLIAAQDKAGKIDGLMKVYYDYGQFNGTILVAENGKIIYKKGFGLAYGME